MCRVANNLATELNEFLNGHRRFGTIDVLVQHLGVLNCVLAAVAHRHDVVEGRNVRSKSPTRQGTSVVLEFEQLQDGRCGHWSAGTLAGRLAFGM